MQIMADLTIPSHMAFHDFLRNAREKNNFTQEGLVDEVNKRGGKLSLRAYLAYEAGDRSPKVETVLQIMSVYDKQLDNDDIEEAEIKGRDGTGERLQYAFSQAGMDRYAFAEKVGVNYDTIGRWIRGNKIPSKGLKRRQIESTTGISADWIETGEGEMLLEPAINTTIDPSKTKQEPAFDLAMLMPGEEMVRTIPVAGEDGELDHYVRITMRWMSREDVEGEKHPK